MRGDRLLVLKKAAAGIEPAHPRMQPWEPLPVGYAAMNLGGLGSAPKATFFLLNRFSIPVRGGALFGASPEMPYVLYWKDAFYRRLSCLLVWPFG